MVNFDKMVTPVTLEMEHLWNKLKCYEHELASVKKQLREALGERERMSAVFELRNHLFEYAETHTLDDLLEETLNCVEKLTDSEISFYHFVEAAQRSLILKNWSTRTKHSFCKAEINETHYELAMAGVWADCFYQRKPVIHNDYASLPHKKGMPPGHATVVRELVTPVIRGDKVVAILGVGNKPLDYDERDVHIVSLFADLAWDIAESTRREKDLQERVKELTCLSAASRLLQEDLSTEETCVRLVELLGPAMQFPDLAVPLIELDTKRFFKTSPEALSHRIFQDIKVGTEIRGQLSIYYSRNENFLIPEEQNLVDGIAHGIGVWLERKQSREQLDHVNQMLRVVRSIDQLIICERNADRLIQQACDMLVETSGYRGAWIGTCSPEKDGGPDRWAVAFGPDVDVSAESFGRMEERPACWAHAMVADGGVVVVEAQTTCAGCPVWRHLDHDSALIILLRYDNRILGMLGVSFSQMRIIEEEEKTLLVEMAGDIAMALHTIGQNEQLDAETSLNKASINAMKDTFFLFNPDSQKALRWNDAFRRISGYSDDEIAELPAPHSYYDAEDLEKAGRATQEVKHTGSARVEMELITKMGDRIPMEYTGALVPGRVSGQHLFVSIGRDLTMRRRAEEALKREQHLLAEIAANYPNSFISIIEKDLTISFSSGQEFRNQNLNPSDFVGVTVEQVFGTLASQVREHYLKTFEGQERTFELVVDGEYKLYRSVPLREKSGRIDRILVVVENITGRKVAERELRSLRNYLSSIINSMPSVLVGVDSECTVTLWSGEAERVTGLPSQNAVGMSLDKAVPGLSPLMDTVREAMQTGIVRSKPRQIRRNKRAVRYEDVTIFPLVDSDMAGAVIRIDDVTDQVRMDEIMVQSEKMMSVGGLAAGMAHEINNPLAGMMQTAELLEKRLLEDFPANDRAAANIGIHMSNIRAFMEARGVPELLGHIRQSGVRAAEIVSNMLSFARTGDADFSNHHIADLLDQAIDLAGSDYDLKKKYDFRQIEIVREYQADVPQVPCEAGKIQQVLLNILRNGAESMRERWAARQESDGPDAPSRFVLRLVHEEEDNEWVRIEIEDSGLGMSEEVRKRVFEPFFTTKPTDQGTGLGLSVSYFIITENHGGEMTVESSPGAGARFIIRLPVG